MTSQEIMLLPKPVRLAGYLARMAAVDELGAQLRCSKEDEQWSEEEQAQWEALCDAVDPWFYALSSEEKQLLNPVIVFMACFARGEDPEGLLKLKLGFHSLDS